MTSLVQVQDVLAALVPPRWRERATAVAAGADMPAGLREELDQLAAYTIARQYRQRGGTVRALIIGKHDWLITSDREAVLAFHPGDGCPACTAGNDQALALLRENPGELLALGNLRYTEVWDE